MRDVRKMVFFSLLVAFGIALHVLEAQLPSAFFLPGVKLGLANIVTLLALSLYGWRAGLTVAVIRVLLGSLVSGTFLSIGFILGLSGAVVSALMMGLLEKSGIGLSLIGISIAGAVAHNMSQLVMASFLVQTKYIVVYYLPLLLFAALPMGFLTGFVARLLIRYLEKAGVWS